MSNDKLGQAVELIGNGEVEIASKILARIVLDNPQDEIAWYWLSKCMTEPEKKRFCLKKVLEINPNNHYALDDLNILGEDLDTTNHLLDSTETREEDLLPTWVTPDQCPNCYEIISPDDKVCRSCGYHLSPIPIQPTRPNKAARELSSSVTRPITRTKINTAKRNRLWFIIILIVAISIGSWLIGPSLLRSIRTGGAFPGFHQITNAPIVTDNQVKSPAIPITSTVNPTSSPSPVIPQDNKVDEWEGITVGMCAGNVLLLHPESEFINQPLYLNNDSEGFIVQWTYTEAYLILARRWGEDEIYCYRVLEIHLRD